MGYIVGSSYLEHKRLIAAEKSAFSAPGVLVTPGSEAATLHVYAEGRGDPTLVFLSGLGTSSPYFDFKDLFERLSDSFRIAVVERAGYGWSASGERSRDLPTVLSETRTALLKAGERPPFVLVPHSLAGLEAMYWAQRHPQEVAAIIGLDPLVPSYILNSGETTSMSLIETLLARSGLMRSGPEIFEKNFPAMAKGRLNAAEAEIAKTLFMRRTHTPEMWDETRTVADNAALVHEAGAPHVPLFAFVSDQASDLWKESILSYVEGAASGKAILMDGGHYLHLDQPAEIAARIEAIANGVTGEG